MVVQNILLYRISATKISDFKLSTSEAVKPKSLSTSKCVELVKSGLCERFLRRFAVDYIPSASAHSAPVCLAENDLLELVKRSSKVMVTCDEIGSRQICSISFAELLLLKTRLGAGDVKMQVQYFGSSLDDLADHARAHLSHSVDVTRGQDVNVMFNFPACIDREAASATFSRDVTRGLKNQQRLTCARLSSFKLDPATREIMY